VKKKIALVLGCTGQDGSYMCELLLKKNYIVYGLLRKTATDNTKNIKSLIHNKKYFNKTFFLQRGDLLDLHSFENAISKIKPEEIYNFADQDNVSWSTDIPSYSMSVTGASVVNMFEKIKNTKKKIKFFQPLTSNMFAWDEKGTQNEKSVLSPSSIYALSKSTVYLAAKMYKKLYNLHICGAIFFNHESPRRRLDYVTQKIVHNACEIYLGRRKYVELGDINIKIDWGYAKDYVEAAWKIMQQKKSDFFVIGSGRTYSVKEFGVKVFKYLNLDFHKHLKKNKKFLRKGKNSNLRSNISKARKTFGYRPKTNLNNLIKIMVDDCLKKIS